MNIEEELNKIGLTRSQYEDCLQDMQNKLNGLNDMDWSEIQAKYNLPITSEHLRKSQQRPFGGSFVKEYFESNSYPKNSIDYKLEELRKEKIKLQTLNIERGRLDRNAARQELYFETIRKVLKELDPPDFKPLCRSEHHQKKMSYILGIADIHYGSNFKSQNNYYSTEIATERMMYLLQQMENFVKKHSVDTLTIVSLGDDIQGLLRLSDLNINDTTVVKAIVEVSRLLAWFLNELSKYVYIEYYHTPSANHTQLRVLNAKASELAEEDVEYIIGNYIQDIVSKNERINVHLANENESFIKIDMHNFVIYALHGHQIKNVDNSLRDLSMLVGTHIDYLLLGHWHSGKEISSYESAYSDAEILISPSFIGSEPYSDRLMKGSKAAVKIYGFDEVYGHVESYKIILN